MKTSTHTLTLATVVAAAIALSGCATKVVEKQVPVERIVTRTVYPDYNLLRDCDIAPPPPRKAYLKLTEAGKEKALADYGSANVISLGKCNQDKKSLRDWYNKKKAEESGK